MNAYRIMLTHFSQRYPKIPVLNSIDERICIASDMMTIDWQDLALIPKLVPSLRCLFKDTEEEEEKEGE